MESILFEVSDQVGWITLNRPEKFNAFNRPMALRLQEVLEECNQRKDVRAVYITGAGKAFCAGQDLQEVLDPEGPGMNRILSEHYNPIVLLIRRIEKPVVVAVNGVAAGAGANLAICADITVAAESSKFIQAFSKIGLIPDSGGTFYLPRLIGWQKASALMMLGDAVSAIEAERMGMIYQYFSDDTFVEKSKAIAIKLAKMPTRALFYTKKALNWSALHTIDEQLMNEDKLQQRAASTDDFKEGVQAFVEKRNPNFKGE